MVARKASRETVSFSTQAIIEIDRILLPSKTKAIGTK